MQLTPRSLFRISQVHPALKLITLAAHLNYTRENPSLDFQITEGIRTLEQQKAYFKAGRTKTLDSFHLAQDDGFSHAVDVHILHDGVLAWDWPLYATLSAYFKAAAEALTIPLVWGGDWRKFRDGPHYQINRHWPLGDYEALFQQQLLQSGYKP